VTAAHHGPATPDRPLTPAPAAPRSGTVALRSATGVALIAATVLASATVPRAPEAGCAPCIPEPAAPAREPAAPAREPGAAAREPGAPAREPAAVAPAREAAQATGVTGTGGVS
jgi:hypothetical protein